MNVLIEKTVPLFYTPDQTMYPGALPVCWAHEFHFLNLEGYTQASIWEWDIVSNRFYNRCPMSPIVNNTLTLPFTVLAPLTGIMVLQFSTTLPTKLSNKFTWTMSNQDQVQGGSINLGEATNDVPFNGIQPVLNTIISLPTPITKKHGNH